jgi:hypothetical protein
VTPKPTDHDADEEFAPPPPRPRFRRVRKLALWCLGLFAAVVLVLYVARFQMGRMGQRQLNIQQARLDQTDPGWRLDAILEERQKKEPPADQNSATLVLKLAADIPQEWRDWWKSEDASRLLEARDYRLPPREVVDAARKPEAASMFVRAEALRLRDKKAGAYPLTIAPDPIATLLPHLNKAREVAALLQYDGSLAAIDKKPNRGVLAARAALGVARSIGDEPLLISQLVRIACAMVAAQTAMRVLACGAPDEWLVELQAELLAEADTPWFEVGMRGERALLDRVFQGFADGTIPPENWFNYAGIKNPGPEHYAAFRSYRALMPGDRAKCLEITTAYLEAAKLPHHERLAVLKAVPIPAGPPEEIRYILTRLLVPASEKVAEAGLRTRAYLLSAATCVACERFRRKHGRWPNGLAELTPTFLPAVPLNPFDGKPPTYRVYPDRIVVHCFWANSPLRMDELPDDFREPHAPGVGLGFRVWNPESRGMPPEEKKAP